MKKHFGTFMGLIIIVLLLSACQLQQETIKEQDPVIETGINDPEYNGIVNPELDVEYKLTAEEQRDGIKKLDMEGEEIDLDHLEAEEGDSDDEGARRPNI